MTKLDEVVKDQMQSLLKTKFVPRSGQPVSVIKKTDHLMLHNAKIALCSNTAYIKNT